MNSIEKANAVAKYLKEKICRGCKWGYQSGKRDVSKAKCKIKICCINKRYNSCADCSNFTSCNTIQEFYNKKSYKYKKYKEAVEFIQSNGYAEFVELADKWKMQYGKL
ncbi:MAG: DUF3795 domain-containing protein [Ignavibacteriales bacterium]|nr:DUF3795 domain-containing protein [Ignavibacteriales bacterium]